MKTENNDADGTPDQETQDAMYRLIYAASVAQRQAMDRPVQDAHIRYVTSGMALGSLICIGTAKDLTTSMGQEWDDVAILRDTHTFTMWHILEASQARPDLIEEIPKLSWLSRIDFTQDFETQRAIDELRAMDMLELRGLMVDLMLSEASVG